jgi:hypothetical protein
VEVREMPSTSTPRRLTEEQKKLRYLHTTLNILGKIPLPIDDNGKSFLNEQHREGMRLLVKVIGILADLDYELKISKN